MCTALQLQGQSGIERQWEDTTISFGMCENGITANLLGQEQMAIE